MSLSESTSRGSGRFAARCRRVLTRRWLPLFLAGLAAVLTLPSLGVGLVADDYHAALLMQGSDSPVRLMDSPLDLFRFFRGPEEVRRMRDFGFVPWWTDLGVRASFWRPLTSVTHWLDYRLWPEVPALMHGQSIAWYAGCVLVVSVWYRRLMGLSVTAGLAGLLYAVDDAHGPVVGFLANRNALIAVVFGVLSLIAHDRWRREGWRYGVVAGPLLLLLSLLSKEAGVAVAAYLAAYAVFVDRGEWRGRVVSLVPYGVVIVAWRWCWTWLGYGVSGVGLYVDPLTEPGRFMLAVLERGPLLLLGQWGLPPSELTSALMRDWPTAWWALVVCLAVLAVLLVPLLRRDRMARFWAAGMLLSLVPMCAVFPADRVLMFPGIGAMALVGQFLTMVGEAKRDRGKAFAWRLPARGLAGVLVAVHLVIAPLMLPVRSMWFMGPRWLRDEFRPSGALDASMAEKELILVNPPEAFLVMESPLIWAAEGEPLPRRLRMLVSSHLQPVTVYRADARTVVLRPEAGFLKGLMDPLMRRPDQVLRVGERIELPGMTVEVTALMDDGRPAEAAFRFDVPLEDESLVWMKWEDGAYVPFEPPAVGEEVTLPASWGFLW